MRVPIPDSVRIQVLLANRHACCLCQRIDVQIHHIDGNASNNDHSNLAVLCLLHHDKVTAPPSLTASLKPAEIRTYKKSWEELCAKESVLLARSRTAFFMVDYKNADRLRQLFLQLSQNEYLDAYTLLTTQFMEEETWRKQQGFDVSLEPNTSWNPAVAQMLKFVRSGDVHPRCFQGCNGHPLDPLYARGFAADGTANFVYYDLWCQIMARAVLAARGSYDIEDLMQLKDLSGLSLEGKLISFFGRLRGSVAHPDQYVQQPLSQATLDMKIGAQRWRTELELKTHYVYSVTAAASLSKGCSSGLLMLREISEVKGKGNARRVEFRCTPLIIGSGGGGPLKIPPPSRIN